MNFTIYAVIVTVVAVIYFSTMIAMDLFGSANNKKKDEEVFDNSDMADEPSTIVEETDTPGGFRIHRDDEDESQAVDYDYGYDNENRPAAQPAESLEGQAAVINTSVDEEAPSEGTDDRDAKYDKLKRCHDEDMEDIPQDAVAYQESYESSAAFHIAMTRPEKTSGGITSRALVNILRI